jgi:predicted nucleotidyltransferase/8-oxo-dGTP pyrophosphatase MutT (NUDIX family)
MKFNKEDRIKRTSNAIIHESAGGFLFFQEPHSRRLFVALLKTSNGEYVIPKGHLKKTESAENAALREMKEELSLGKDPRIVSKLGISRYTFTRDEDKLPHKKKVHLYLFYFANQEKILPLKSEGFVAAKWFLFQDAVKKITFNKEDLIRAKKIFSLSHLPVGGSLLDKAVADMVQESKKILAANLFAVILSGSIARGTYRDGWSDVDILLVVEEMSLGVKNKIAEMIRKLEKKTGIHHGINVVTAKEIIRPNKPTVSLDGKTLQALAELKQHPDRLLYIKEGHFSRFYVPTKKEVKEYSLANIGMFSRKNRRDLTMARPLHREWSKEILKTEIRASLTMVKLAIQCFGEYSEEAPILDQATKTFPSYDFEFLERAQELVKKWPSFNDKKAIATAIMQADRFIEEFSQYTYKRSEGSHHH